MPSGIDFNLNNIVNGLQDVIKLDQTIKDVQSKAREKIVITTSVSPKSTKDIISLKNNIKDLKAQKQELYELDSKMSNGAKDSNYTNTFNDLVRDIDSAINQANDKIDDFKSYVKSFASDLRVSFDNARISLEDIINTGDVDKALLLFSNLYYSIYNLKNIDPDLSIVDSEDIREAEILRDIFDSLSSILSGEMDEDYFDNLKRGMNSLGLEISDIEEKLRKSFSSKAIQNAIDDLTTKIDSIKQKVSGHQYVDTDEIEKEREELNGLVSDLEKLTTIDSKFKKSISSVKGLLTKESKKMSIASDANKSNISSPIKESFQSGASSAKELEEEIERITVTTDKAGKSLDEYKEKWKILKQVGDVGDDKYSATFKRNEGQIESVTWKAQKDAEGNVLFDDNGNKIYDQLSVTISNYKELEKVIVGADNKLRQLEDRRNNLLQQNPKASTSGIDAQIVYQREYIELLEQTVKNISQADEYLLEEKQIIEARNKAEKEYNLAKASKQDETQANAEKKRLANIEQVNRALNKQQIAIDSIEKTYNKSANPDLDREVSNQQDLLELASKKAQIQTKIKSLQGQERTSANEKEFLELEKLIAEYKELAKYKLKSNNPSKQELGGQNLQTLIQTQISLYDKLIIKAEQYGDETNDVVKKLKEQRDILSKIDSDGKYTATADDYYASRDIYKVEKASLSAYEAEAKAAEKQWNAIKAAREKSEKKAKTNQSLKQSETDKAAKEQLSAYEKIKKLKFEISKTTDTDTLSSLKAQLKIEQDRYLNATKILKANSDYFDKDAQNLKITQARLEAEQRIAQYKKNQSDNQAKEQQKAIEAARKESLKKSESEQKAKQSETDKALKDQLNAYKKIQEIKYKLSYTEDDGERSKLLERQKLYQEEFANAGKILSANSELYSIEQQTNELTKVRLEYEEKIAKYKADQRENQLSSIQNSVESYLGDYKKRNNGRPVDPNRSHEYQQLLDKYKASIDALQVKKDELSKQPTISEDDLDSVKKMTDAVEENKNALIAMSAAEKGSTEGSRRKEIDKITKYLKDNTRISEEAKTKLKEYLDLLRNGGADVNVDEIHNGFLKVTEAERLAGNEGKRFLDVIRDKAWYGWAAQIASYFSLQDIIRYFKEGATVVKEFDDGLTNISYTMDVTKSQLDGIGQSVLDLSKDLKSSIDDSMQVAKIYANMNTTAEEIKKLSEPTLIMSNLTGFDASTMADDIQAVTQQFEIAAEDSMHIADVYDTISRNISVDYSKILELTLETM